MRPEKPAETAQALLPGLQYLAREALDAGLLTVAGIIGQAASEGGEWIHDNDDDLDAPPEERNTGHGEPGRRAATGPGRA